MRKYQPIWEQLKATGLCTVATPPTLQRRVRKAVYKEKDKDTAYKVEWDIKGGQPEIRTCVDKKNPNLLKFKLIKPTLLEDLI